MDKLGRTYLFSMQIDNNPNGLLLDVRLPTTIEFDISRNFLGGGANHSTFRIYNLSQQHRNDARFDWDNYAQFRNLNFTAGYGKSIFTIFNGNVTRAHSMREGNNFITTVEAVDNGYIYSEAFFSQTIPANTSLTDQMKQIIKSFPTKPDPNDPNNTNGVPIVTIGAIGNFPNKNARASSYSKPSVQLLKELSDNKFFIDNGKAHVLNNNEYIDSPVLVINPQTGLLNTPQLEDQNLTFDIVFEPRVNVGTLVQVQSSTDKKFNNRLWRVNAVKHRGMISGAVCGEVITTIQINYGSLGYIPVRQAS